MHNEVKVSRIDSYDVTGIYNSLPDEIFDIIKHDNTVILKPNWVKESHLFRPADWEYVITHPTVIMAVLMKVLDRLGNNGKVIITDGPQTDSSFKKLIGHYPVKEWEQLAEKRGVSLEVIDLRDDEWVNEGDVTVKRTKLTGDPRGKIEVNLLGNKSEFHEHIKSKRGYYGADYDISETNRAHDGKNNLYSVSRSVINGDVFINLPKLKTHKKSGITCCLKNLVGINTYKNYLPHHCEGGPSEGGDQFPSDNLNARLEGPIMAFIKQHFIRNLIMAKLFKPLKKIGKKTFGDTNTVIRSGNWHGNDTIWRMILDLNKVLFYANPDGSMREGKWNNAKKYIGIVDGILAGEGNGPMSPDPVEMNYIFCGSNPVAIDAVCARFMGFNPMKILSIKNSFKIRQYHICNFSYDDIVINIGKNKFKIADLPRYFIVPFKPHFGWINYIEG
ncbi:MAG: DUF362 domain-containing protein [Candidatus Margulisiibacteriota bacterium]|nr:MAG: hypothetical protein A2X43_13210 [Candidatus Margulisbacteria bacterium GWD2_39_127]OGI04784.1 MAG: hypothetical protein A2X42_10785 [Candidatus Margulisbacteria bacterium GWF2_38_17]OGI05729.1 MAG: hypothetical protein A2X41_03370 [Candidatus Margulisbacteria bacterium GWE2_39_32]PZM83664.1 MAG: DUF362 domain-containing protein [Candidatus Margulisiibacteriota bacterium]HAR62082.1 hypothetical protein [Candidatus Margulisiibacteriota bacterium]